MLEIVDETHWQAAQKLRTVLATYREAEDLINIGAYAKGSNENIDQAVNLISGAKGFLQQQVYEKTTLEETIQSLRSVVQAK